ncbi:2Fe-2S iron-sulfur cluster-binding protein [Nitrospina watsonii]|uniref:Ferredoxin, root r-b2 (Ferredoxin) n=1 Tax=Nitrospina watsonii TaxID=1323948 RepID=A0ABM9HDJ7_9BACT|nr:2Fe-2S iron-sulfur cluster-binding protein [Nitrospina watsonii]CAI2718315.1 Putative Ferredoxin, root r-b2 (ferredoxin) [Nitrospina watsonii]
MAKVVFQPDNVTHECEDGMSLIDICEEVEVSLSFGCTEGTCGVCELTVLEGRENLSKITEEEKDYLYEEDLEGGMRLGCQVKVRKGDIVLSWKGNRAK